MKRMQFTLSMKVFIFTVDIVVVQLMGLILLHVIEVLVRYPCNHADHPTFCYMDAIVALVLFDIVYSVWKRRINLVFWLIFLLALLIPYLEDKYNVMVPYKTWVVRGMPDWGTQG